MWLRRAAAQGGGASSGAAVRRGGRHLSARSAGSQVLVCKLSYMLTQTHIPTFATKRVSSSGANSSSDEPYLYMYMHECAYNHICECAYNHICTHMHTCVQLGGRNLFISKDKCCSCHCCCRSAAKHLALYEPKHAAALGFSGVMLMSFLSLQDMWETQQWHHVESWQRAGQLHHGAAGI